MVVFVLTILIFKHIINKLIWWGIIQICNIILNLWANFWLYILIFELLIRWNKCMDMVYQKLIWSQIILKWMHALPILLACLHLLGRRVNHFDQWWINTFNDLLRIKDIHKLVRLTLRIVSFIKLLLLVTVRYILIDLYDIVKSVCNVNLVLIILLHELRLFIVYTWVWTILDRFQIMSTIIFWF